MRNGEKIPAGDNYLTDSFTREAVSFIDRHSNKQPFFLYLPHNAVHYGRSAELTRHSGNCLWQAV